MSLTPSQINSINVICTRFPVGSAHPWGQGGVRVVVGVAGKSSPPHGVGGAPAPAPLSSSGLECHGLADFWLRVKAEAEARQP